MSSELFDKLSEALEASQSVQDSVMVLYASAQASERISNLFNELSNAISHAHSNPLVKQETLYQVVGQGVEHLRPQIDKVNESS